VIRVFLVEDHELFASGVRNELGQEFALVGHAASVAEAVAEIPKANPDVVLLDVHLPDGNGPEVVEALRRMGHRIELVPEVRIVGEKSTEALA